MRSPTGVVLRPSQELRLEHRLWLHRRLARGLAHELANLHQMLMLPDPPPEMREELDTRLMALVDSLGRLAREPDVDPGATPCPALEAWREAARTHDRLGGEPHVPWTVVAAAEAPVAWACAERLHRALVAVLVMAARSLNRQRVEPPELRVEDGAAVRFVAEAPAGGAPPDPDEAWFRACADAWLECDGGRLDVERDALRVRYTVTVPAAHLHGPR